MLDLKTYVLEHVEATEYYKVRFGREFNPKVRRNVKCVFHTGDTKPSLSINLRNGGARCFAASCSKSIGNIVHFESEAAGISETDAAHRIYREFVRPIVEKSVVERYASNLGNTPKLQQTFTRATGLNLASIEKFEIGYDNTRRRYTIPIYNAFNQVINIRFYRPKSMRKKDDVKIYSYVENKGRSDEVRYGNIELYPWPILGGFITNKPVFIMASEREAMLAIQLGLQAVCATAGEGSWLEEWTELFSGMDIGVLFDPDKGGQKASEKIVATLQPIATHCIPIWLKFDEKYKGDKDFDDWILSKQGTAYKLLQQFQERVESKEIASSHPSSSENGANPPLASSDGITMPKFYDDKVHDLQEVQASKEMMNLAVKTRGIIAAVATRTFDIPWNFEIKTKSGRNLSYAMPAGRDLIAFVGMDDDAIVKDIAAHANQTIVGKRVKNWVGVYEAEIVPIADVGSDSEGRYTVQRSFVLGKHIDANVPYEFTVIPTTLTRTQEKIFIVIDAVEIARAIDTWTFSERQQNELKIFQPKGEQTVDEKLLELANELSVNHTKIYSRPDWHIVALLSWFCPIGFYFPSEPELQRGWLNTLAIGDTQTGKSKVAQVLQRLLRLGDIVNAENCTFVGLVGGAIKASSGQMMLRWGRLPLCDKKLVLIEEFSGLSITEISHMSEVRSRGIARLDKGGLSSQTPARTRFIALSNVRPMNKTLAQYLTGVKAIQDLIGHAEDISRFDLLVTLIDSEVSSDIINSPSDESLPPTFTADQLRTLCQFAWAIKPEKIHFTEDAYLACLDWTQKLQQIYHPSVPIFKAASGRLLLARIGVAVATLQFSWDGQRLIIEEEHINSAVNLLRGLYDKSSFGYLEYSNQMFDRERIKDVEMLEAALRKDINASLVAQTFESLIHASKFSRDELAATGSMQIFQADDLIGFMLRSRVIRKGEANVWEITQAGKAWMMSKLEKK